MRTLWGIEELYISKTWDFGLLKTKVSFNNVLRRETCYIQMTGSEEFPSLTSQVMEDKYTVTKYTM